MSLDHNTPVPSHDENVAHAAAALDQFIMENPDKFDYESFIPDDVDPNTLDSLALKDAMQPQVYARSGDLLLSYGDSAESAYANLHDMDVDEVMWIMEMANSIQCYISHLNDMAQDRIETIAMSHVPEGHPMHADYARTKAGNGLPAGIAELLSEMFGGNIPASGIEMIDLSGNVPPSMDLNLDDLPTARPEDVPPDERL